MLLSSPVRYAPINHVRFAGSPKPSYLPVPTPAISITRSADTFQASPPKGALWGPGTDSSNPTSLNPSSLRTRSHNSDDQHLQDHVEFMFADTVQARKEKSAREQQEQENLELCAKHDEEYGTDFFANCYTKATTGEESRRAHHVSGGNITPDSIHTLSACYALAKKLNLDISEHAGARILQDHSGDMLLDALHEFFGHYPSKSTAVKDTNIPDSGQIFFSNDDAPLSRSNAKYFYINRPDDEGRHMYSIIIQVTDKGSQITSVVPHDQEKAQDRYTPLEVEGVPVMGFEALQRFNKDQAAKLLIKQEEG